MFSASLMSTFSNREHPKLNLAGPMSSSANLRSAGCLQTLKKVFMLLATTYRHARIHTAYCTQVDRWVVPTATGTWWLKVLKDGFSLTLLTHGSKPSWTKTAVSEQGHRIPLSHGTHVESVRPCVSFGGPLKMSTKGFHVKMSMLRGPENNGPFCSLWFSTADGRAPLCP